MEKIKHSIQLYNEKYKVPFVWIVELNFRLSVGDSIHLSTLSSIGKLELNLEKEDDLYNSSFETNFIVASIEIEDDGVSAIIKPS